MSQLTVGIILPGNPDKVWKEPAYARVFNYIVRFGWVVVAIFCLALYGSWFSHPNKRGADVILQYAKTLLSVTLVMLSSAWIICSKKRRCPYCHHYFQVARMTKDQFEGSSTRTISRDAKEYGTATAYDLSGNVTFINTTNHYTQYGTETTKTYSYKMRCRHCGCVQKFEKEKTSESY